MKIIAVEDDNSMMFFCGFSPDENSVNKEILPHLCYNYDSIAVKRYDTEESMLADLIKLQEIGINAFATDTSELRKV